MGGHLKNRRIAMIDTAKKRGRPKKDTSEVDAVPINTVKINTVKEEQVQQLKAVDAYQKRDDDVEAGMEAGIAELVRTAAADDGCEVFSPEEEIKAKQRSADMVNRITVRGPRRR
jgi:hypothetical protein